VNGIGSLFSRRTPRERPDLASWIAESAPILVVDGSGPDAVAPTFAGATIVRHETSGAPGLPFHDRDPRRLAWPADERPFRAVALADVLDKVLDVAFAIDEALRVVVDPATLVVVQTVAPEDFEERAIWNALAKMRDPRHAWTPSARQLAAQISALRMQTVREAAWEESVDPAATLRPDVADRLARMIDAAAARGADDVIRDGAFVASRRAWLLRGS